MGLLYFLVVSFLFLFNNFLWFLTWMGLLVFWIEGSMFFVSDGFICIIRNAYYVRGLNQINEVA